MTWKREVPHIVLLLLAFPLHGEELTLDQAVQLAVKQNRGVRNSLLDVAKANNRIAQLHTRLLPSLNFYALGSQQLQAIDFTFNRGLLGVYPGIGPVPAEDTTVRTPLQPTGILLARVSQPLSTLHRIRLDLKTLQLNARIAEEQSRQQRLDVVRNVKKLYYGIQQLESSRQGVAETLKLYQELDRLTQNYLKQQTALEADALAVQANLARTEQTSLTLDDQEATAKEQLNQILGRDVLTEFSVGPIAEAGEFETDMPAARKRALDMRPEIRKARLQIAAAEQDVRAKRAEYIPDIAADFNNVTLLNFNQFIPSHFTGIGVSLSWEPFDWGRRKNELAEKRNTAEQAKTGAADAESLIIIDVNDKFRRLRQTRAQLRVARLTRQAAVENLRVIRNRYQVEASLLKDVLEAQARVEQANTASEQALADFWTARAEFERALGEDQ
jgi:outer membrane protein